MDTMPTMTAALDAIFGPECPHDEWVPEDRVSNGAFGPRVCAECGVREPRRERSEP